MKRLGLVAVALALVTAAKAQDAPSATEIVERSQQAFYEPGVDMRAKVTMALVTSDGQTRTRVLTMLRKNELESRRQKYFLYFHEPGDVRRTAFLIWKYPEKDDDRWLFIPAVGMVRRLAARDNRSSFIGSDFTYEDLSGRDVSADTHDRVGEKKIGNRDCYLIRSVPRLEMDYTKKLSWIDKKSFLPLKEEYYDAQGELARRFTADRIEDIVAGSGGGTMAYPTIMKRTMTSVKSGHRTEVTFTDVAYDLGIEDDVFTERALQSPPQKWIR